MSISGFIINNQTYKYDFDELDDKPVIDEELSLTSSRAVQNRAIAGELEDLKLKTLISEFSGASYGKYGGTFQSSVDATLYGMGFAYSGYAYSIDVKKDKLYVLAYLSSNGSTTRKIAFSKSLNDSSVVMAVELNDSGTLGNTVTNFTPTYPDWHFNPSNNSGQIWDTETYDQWNIRVYDTLPEIVNETTYYWKGVSFVPNRDFHGVISIAKDNALVNQTYFLLFEVNDNDWNPYLDGGMEKGFVLKETFEEKMQAVCSTYLAAYEQRTNSLLGKKWACCGDSLTEYSGGQCHTDNPSDTGFITQIARRTGVIGINLGTAGETWASKTNGSYESGSAVERVHTIVTNDQDYDIITFAYGTNADTDGNGTAADEPAYDGTMCAAIKWCIEELVKWKPEIQIGIILPPKRAEGNSGMKTKGDLIREVAIQYGIPCCDMWGESGMTLQHYTNPDTGNEKYYYFSDGLHLNSYGAMKYGNLLEDFIRKIAPIY